MDCITINLPSSFFHKEITILRNLSGYMTNTSTSFDLNSTVKFFEASFDSIATVTFSFSIAFLQVVYSLVPFVHMITGRRNFGLKREALCHFVKIVWKD